MLAACTPTKQETWVQSLGREDPLEEGVAAHSSNVSHLRKKPDGKDYILYDFIYVKLSEKANNFKLIYN